MTLHKIKFPIVMSQFQATHACERVAIFSGQNDN